MKSAVSAIIVAALLLDCGFSLAEDVQESFPRVVTPLGEVEGYYKTASNGRRYAAYEGIRYAHPPVGESRFEIAQGISPWPGVWKAKQFGPTCMQYIPLLRESPRRILGSEDCLYLNIYTPTANGEANNLLPVIFYIHGGGFQIGSANIFKSEYLLDRNVTLVTFNYRLGILGFLSTEDELIPGNMGLKDQVIALRWVKDNIQSFGGDPSRISIFGQSAGGASVHYHYLTNLTTGLFQRGMALSGTALQTWAQTEKSLDKAKKLALIVGCSNWSNDIAAMVRCLKSKPVDDIVKATVWFLPFTDTIIPFGPVVEKKRGNFTFIDRSPIDIINSGGAHDLPWITGIVSEEGLVGVGPVINKPSLLRLLDTLWDPIAPILLDFYYTVPHNDHPRTARLIKQHYLGRSPISKAAVNQTVGMFSDRMFGYDAGEAATAHAKTSRSPIRFYYFSYRGAHSMSEMLTGSSENFGVCHGDDETYVLKTNFDPTTTPQDRAMQKTLIDIWVSYATDGKPVPHAAVEWPAVDGSTNELTYLHIQGPDQFSVESSRDFKEKKFWNSVGLFENRNVTYEEYLAERARAEVY